LLRIKEIVSILRGKEMFYAKEAVALYMCNIHKGPPYGMGCSAIMTTNLQAYLQCRVAELLDFWLKPFRRGRSIFFASSRKRTGSAAEPGKSGHVSFSEWSLARCHAR